MLFFILKSFKTERIGKQSLGDLQSFQNCHENKLIKKMMPCRSSTCETILVCPFTIILLCHVTLTAGDVVVKW